MLQIKDKQTTPNKGWDYQAPDGTLIAGGDFNDLVMKALDYHVKHGLPTDNLAALVEDEMCRRKPVKCAPPRPTPDGERTIGVADVWRFLRTMMEWAKNREFVVQAEAERRAEICAGCKFNGEVTDGSCWGCTNIFGMVEQIIGERTTRVDHALKNCRVCGCLNKVACWLPLDVMLKASGSVEYPADTDGNGTPCWKKSEQ